MKGPYTVKVYLSWRRGDSPYGVEPDLTLDYGDVDEYQRVCYGYWSSGLGATKVGTLRAAVFAIADLLEPGESARLDEWGFVAGEPKFVDGCSVRRDDDGEVYSSIGTRFGNERHYQGAAALLGPLGNGVAA